MRELPELFALVYDDANSNNVAHVYHLLPFDGIS
jgi:hypothetical protein